jgi:hypothetical protein
LSGLWRKNRREMEKREGEKKEDRKGWRKNKGEERRAKRMTREQGRGSVKLFEFIFKIKIKKFSNLNRVKIFAIDTFVMIGN